MCVYSGGYGIIGGEGASDRYSPAAKYLYWTIFKKSRHLGFGVFIDIWSMLLTKEEGERIDEEPNHMTTRKPGPL